jgi:transcriptional regulator with XRE-family HTH domain
MLSFGQILKTLREKAGLTQAELAGKAGTSQKAISFWERGEREPAFSRIRKLCNALDVPCGAFFGETERPAEKSAKGPRPRKGVRLGREAIDALHRLRGEPKITAMRLGLDWIRAGREPAEGSGPEEAKHAIATLKRISKRDELRSRGFEIVTNWIEQQLPGKKAE